MKDLTKKRAAAVLFSVLPMIIYFLILILLVLMEIVGEKIYGSDASLYDMVFPLFNAVSMAAAAVIMCRILKKRTGKELTAALSMNDFDWLLMFLLLFFSWCAGNVADGIVAYVCSPFMTVTANASPITPLAILEAVFAAPILEEILFRYLGTEFAEQYFSMPVLCIANALYFTLLHGYNIQGFANIMVFALCMVYVYLKTRRLAYMILVHMLHNASCLLDYDDQILFGSPIYHEKNGFLLGSLPWMGINCIVAIICAVIYLKKYRRQRYGE